MNLSLLMRKRLELRSGNQRHSYENEVLREEKEAGELQGWNEVGKSDGRACALQCLCDDAEGSSSRLAAYPNGR